MPTSNKQVLTPWPAAWISSKEMARQVALPPDQRVEVIDKLGEGERISDNDQDFSNTDHVVNHIFGGSTAYASKRRESTSGPSERYARAHSILHTT
ncbi:hypothetical protein E2562_018468 [Oryza meyeriana var. granulata]|uniref:Uncharacterized protein n=1 Tax=Oryza meyeriana var. granulata TaxID=110450 RepID=A0A6G1EMI6_9ORYZ|nr:hypothetical protein E2562_018468 [Oryza meyeriana var. granulata]